MRKAKGSAPITMSAMDHKWFDKLGDGPMVKAALAVPKAKPLKAIKSIAKPLATGNPAKIGAKPKLKGC